VQLSTCIRHSGHAIFMACKLAPISAIEMGLVHVFWGLKEKWLFLAGKLPERKWKTPNLTNFRANLGQRRICINFAPYCRCSPFATLSKSIRAEPVDIICDADVRGSYSLLQPALLFWKKKSIFSVFKSYWHMTNSTWKFQNSPRGSHGADARSH